ncbi:CRISPR-associated helicase Cas3' [Chlorobium phaeovibrioides]|uniref:CRISPR-associated helicase Cas3 n=1 Tax=Chlorobium phaeovibrioides TaxID=1094 RepID=A0ABW9USY5_CHLPH|nr:CRISPR-associated helicase Cas3' [Chlorobium phaeovibrioides]MWV55042.1 CRISPR-associated helicase Cas3' [Chlorobium phaeovibrioides]
MGKIDHSSAGALHAVNKNGQVGRILAYLIAGHHAGLPNWTYEPHGGGALSDRLSTIENLYAALEGKPPEELLAKQLPTSIPCGSGFRDNYEAVHLWVRMLYSCLVDADFLDTESFMAPEKTKERHQEWTLDKLKPLFDKHIDQLQQVANATPVNTNRKAILEECKNKASLAPGVFSLTVPTGGGKTLSSMAFALEHAIKYKKKRVIIAIPYTSIIEQTAAIFRKIFGSDAVLEHHSNLDPDRETQSARLSSENWDAPIIVTTNVQLFESLFAARSSSCRKLHNLVNSVIILDEAQTLPTGFLQPILSSLKVLTEYFKASLLLCTATQPILTERIGSDDNILNGFKAGSVREIISNPNTLFEIFQRVKVYGPKSREKLQWEEVKDQLCQHPQVLCIVNTRKDCSELHQLMPEGTVHLSALMCPEHRSEVIAAVKEQLMTNQPIRVISTQLLEAGVDIDFPVVYRAFSGLDSIAQAAGRCNREGLLDYGHVTVFNPPTPSPKGIMLKAEQAAQEVFNSNPKLAASLMPGAFQCYFRAYFNSLNNFDEQSIMDLLAGTDAREFKLQFRTAAQRFKLINNAHQHGVIVKYQSQHHDSTQLIKQLRDAGPSRYLMRRLQRFSVNVYQNDLQEMQRNGVVENIEGLWVQTAETLYNKVFGLDVKAGVNLYW